MDLSKFKTSDWLKVGGGVVMLIAGFLTWWQPSCPSGSGAACDAAIDSLGLDFTAFDLTFSGLFPWLLLVAVGALTFLAAAGIFKLPPKFPLPIIFLAASAYSLIFVVGRFFIDPFETGLGLGGETERGIGLYMALVAVVLTLVGSLQGFKESGGNLNDLKDVNKLKASFGGGGHPGGSTPPPPPPPPGMTPPPPPPPAG